MPHTPPKIWFVWTVFTSGGTSLGVAQRKHLPPIHISFMDFTIGVSAKMICSPIGWESS